MKEIEITEKKELTVREAGRLGGSKTRDKYGPEFYSRIGTIGGETVAKRGKEYFSEIGKKGGQAVKTKHGSKFYAKIGALGGDATKKKYGAEYYKKIGSSRWKKQPETEAEME